MPEKAGPVEIGLQLVETAEIAVDCGLEVAFRGLRTAGGHHLPEHRVVGMAAERILRAHADRLGELLPIREQPGDRAIREHAMVLREILEVGDKAAMVPLGVDFHCHRIDMRLQRIEGIAELRQGARPAVIAAPAGKRRWESSTFMIFSS